MLFIDVSTLQSDEKAGALYELQNDAIYSGMKSVREGNIYGVLPITGILQISVLSLQTDIL